MRIPDPLKRLDARILPPMAAAFGRLSRGARRVRIVRIVAVVVSVVVVLVAVYAAGRPGSRTYGPVGVVVKLGVPEGESIPQYIADSKAQLDRLVADSAGAKKQTRYYALVSMSTYLTPAALATTLDGLDRLQITDTIMRVRSNQQTEIVQLPVTTVPDDVIQGMTKTAARKQIEAADDAALQKKVTGSTLTDRMQRAQYKQEQAIASLEASSYRALCPCVYAAVVYATPDVLGMLAARPEVRVVEARQLNFPGLAVFLPPFPDQKDTAEPPPSSGQPPIGG